MLTLYKKDSKNKIRVWSIEQQSDKFRIHSGLQNGKIVISDWTTCEPKNIGKTNETTPEQQCSLEIEARYKEQLKTGYFESITDVDIELYVEPMLAKKFVDYQHKIDLTKGEYVAQCKFNGIRATITKDSFKTRKGEDILSAPHIFNSLKPFFDQYPDAVLDGELFNNELREKLNEINKLVRKTVHITDDNLNMSEQIVRYYIYDGYNFGNLDKNSPYLERKKFIDLYLYDYKYVEHVKTYEINNKEQLDDIYEDLLKEGHEGIMLRLKNSGYENKRSKSLLKLKPTDDDEFTFLSVEEGSGNWSGKVKMVWLRMKNGKEFKASFKGTQIEAKEFLTNHEHLIGTEVTIYYNGFTGLGVPNFAQFDINNYNKQ